MQQGYNVISRAVYPQIIVLAGQDQGAVSVEQLNPAEYGLV